MCALRVGAGVNTLAGGRGQILWEKELELDLKARLSWLSIGRFGRESHSRQRELHGRGLAVGVGSAGSKTISAGEGGSETQAVSAGL